LSYGGFITDGLHAALTTASVVQTGLGWGLILALLPPTARGLDKALLGLAGALLVTIFCYLCTAGVDEPILVRHFGPKRFFLLFVAVSAIATASYFAYIAIFRRPHGGS
jgi:hypothetical protein